jgi:iron complex outermembrane receptor protein
LSQLNKVWSLLAGLCLAVPAWPQISSNPADLSGKSIQDLMNIEVTSVSKKAQKLSQVAAAIFVITQEDILRSGATNIPDLLRMVPGLDVAQMNANTWAISARGFNLQFADKLLVLIDGRAVYTPLFGGVYWDAQDVPLEDIDRIEVIRGPGGTVWGANAVNGVINISTKKTADTLGGLATAGGGSHEEGFGTVQYGGRIGGVATYRVFTKELDDNHFPGLDGQDGGDDWHLLHGGFRLDTTLSSKDSLTTQGDLYTGNEGNTIVHSSFFPPANEDIHKIDRLSGGNILSRWNHTFSNRSDTTLQFYFDNYSRSGPVVGEGRNTIDVDFQHHLLWGNRQDLIWGLGYRYSEDRTEGTIDGAFLPADWSGSLFNSFVQDQITLRPNRVFLYLGAKFESEYFSGFDLQPSVRLVWTPGNRGTLWAAISRATRTPSRRDVGLNAALAALPGPSEVVLLGNSNFKSEHVLAYELGYRAQPSERASIDVAAFFNVYDHLESVEMLPSFFDPNSVPPLTVYPQSFANKLHGFTEGIEISVNWKVTDRWTLNPGYSFLNIDFKTDASSLDTTSEGNTEGSSPSHQAQLRSRLQLFRNLSWDSNAYFVSSLPAQSVSSYTRLDEQLTWRPAQQWEVSLVGQNLLADHHLEFNDYLQSLDSTQIKRSAYAKITWHFRESK